MTIGSTHNHPADLRITPGADPLPWSARFPNPPDLCFDYRRLVEQAGGIAQATKTTHRICIVGAGVTGLVAARELLRCGFTEITVIEKAKRVGGRHFTVVDGPEDYKKPSTPFELGAMRMPFFNRTGEPPEAGRSLMAYYSQLFGLRTSDFPNPGTPWVNATGIYMREGQLEGQGEPTLLIWQNSDGNTPPPGAALRRVHDKWERFAQRFAEKVAASYGTRMWETLWRQIVERYQSLSFRQLVELPFLDVLDPDRPGDFGGLGMTEDESSIFYAIGIGDGSWGAFYDVCCLYPLRTALFGFSSHLQLIHGRVDEQGVPYAAPYLDHSEVPDSAGSMFKAPDYLGIGALDECLLFLEIPEVKRSLYAHCLARPDGLLTNTSVVRLQRLDNGKIVVHHRCSDEPMSSTTASEAFDTVILTLPSWLIETTVRLEGFGRDVLPCSIVDAWKHAHWETSCKVYARLSKAFLDDHPQLPQILITDSFVHDVYAYRYTAHHAYDCILLSYTWEDDATKLGFLSDAELVDACTQELDRILLRCSNIKQAISPFIDTRYSVVQRWMTDKHALGCAKLYRAGTYHAAISLMRYNRDFGGMSGLYLAGESFSVDAGWTEPCLRTAMDAVINLCDRTQAVFNGGFTLADYPHYQA
ncbi:NAD(P)/FAD-dependent oxidoreductase [Pseudomonas entomophila]|uniref:flavin monoamine oxidase family protein n=1 Tax=Pseudomonas entomophila TaxID=312306 RepID=UPI0015E362ED|nr:NAD(P)/FAD-dependent oxidoreductase [Pseudomonas entomophila]MBA1194785.1 NAD(P)/FAD-dependent oxidoreductase [Pseudomonas entomophila]